LLATETKWPGRCFALCVERPAKPATQARTREAAMIGFIAFAEITGAVLAAFALAVGLEWIGLRGLIRLMPVRRDPPNREGR
jgi:hypothetical protein